MDFIPFQLMQKRLEVARQESDTAFFFHLLYFGEMVVKLTAAGLVAAIVDDRDRHRYQHLYSWFAQTGLVSGLLL